MSPAAVIASYAAYPYAVHLPLLALHALHAFAILQVDGWGLFGSDVGLFKYKAVQASSLACIIHMLAMNIFVST